MRQVVLAAALVLGTAAMAVAASFSGGNGSGPGDAVVISGVSGGAEGIAAEYSWVSSRFPGGQVVQQKLVRQGDRAFDVLTVQAGGSQQDIWFDITSFLGK